MMIPDLIIADKIVPAVEACKKIGVGDQWFPGWDPLAVPDLHAIVSPANTSGDMSGGYDLILRNAYQRQGIDIQSTVRASLREKPLSAGGARAIDVGGKIPWLIVAPTVMEIREAQKRIASVDIIRQATYNLMLEALRIKVPTVGTVILGAGVGGIAYQKAVEAMAEGYFNFLDDYQ